MGSGLKTACLSNFVASNEIVYCLPAFCEDSRVCFVIKETRLDN